MNFLSGVFKKKIQLYDDGCDPNEVTHHVQRVYSRNAPPQQSSQEPLCAPTRNGGWTCGEQSQYHQQYIDASNAQELYVEEYFDYADDIEADQAPRESVGVVFRGEPVSEERHHENAVNMLRSRVEAITGRTITREEYYDDGLYLSFGEDHHADVGVLNNHHDYLDLQFEAVNRSTIRVSTTNQRYLRLE